MFKVRFGMRDIGRAPVPVRASVRFLKNGILVRATGRAPVRVAGRDLVRVTGTTPVRATGRAAVRAAVSMEAIHSLREKDRRDCDF